MGNLSLTAEQSFYNTTILNGGISYHKTKFGIQYIPFFNSSYEYYHKRNELIYSDFDKADLNIDYYRRYYVLGGGINVDYELNKKSTVSFKGFISKVSGSSNSDNNSYYSNSSHPQIIDSIDRTPQYGKDSYLYNFGNINFHHSVDSVNGKYVDVNIDYNLFSQGNIYTGYFVRTDDNIMPLNKIDYINNLPQQFLNLSGKAEYGQSVNSKIKVVAGGNFSNTNTESKLLYATKLPSEQVYFVNEDLTNEYKYHEFYYAAFGKMVWYINEKVNLVCGLRVEGTKYTTISERDLLNKDTNYVSLFPNVAISYTFNRKHQFGVTFNRKILRPSIESLFPGRTYSSPNYFTENNPFLQPTFSYNSEFTYTYKGDYSLLINNSFFQNAIDHFVIPVEDAGKPALQNTILNYGNVYNLDITLSAYKILLNNNVETQLTATYSYLKYSVYNHSLPIASNRNNSLNVTLNNNFFISKKRHFTGTVTYYFIGKSMDVSQRIVNNRSHFDIGLSKGCGKYFVFTLSVIDVLGNNNVLKSFLNTNSLLQSNYQTTHIYSRSLMLMVRYKFGNKQLKQIKVRETANNEIKTRTK